MLTSEIIQKFELYVDDTTELSSAEELDLANKIYHKICDDRPWEFLKKEATGSVSNNAITLPTDFSNILNNYQYTENNTEIDTNQRPAVVFVNGSPYLIVNWSDRKKYINSGGYCYVDYAANQIKFTTSVSGTYSFDYKFVPADLTLTTEPVFPERFQHAIYHGMAVDDMIIQLFEKARSYAQENQSMFDSYKGRMAYWNSQLNMN